MPEVGEVIGTKDKNYKESFQMLQENVLQYVVADYKKGINLEPLISKLKEMDLSKKEPGPPTGAGIKCDYDISKERYKIQLKNNRIG